MISSKRFFSTKAFTLLEMLLVFGTLAIISVAASGFYNNYNKSIEINTTAQVISADLKQMQSKSMSGEGGLKWGIHFVNSTENYYELFSTTDSYAVGKTIISTNYLPNKILFSDPAASSSKDIIFSRISGIATASSVSIVSNGVTQTIEVSAIGTVFYGTTYGNVAVGTNYNITTIAGAHGSISPSGTVSVKAGESQSFSIIPDAGYYVSGLVVDGYFYTPDTLISFSNVVAPHTINATFSVILTAPTITTPTSALVAGTTVTLGANVTSLGIPASISGRGICYSTTANPTTPCSAASGTTTGVYTVNITGLTAGTLYYYRGYATNTTGTAYSADGTFTTLIIPTLTTPTYASITGTTATLGANITSLGTPATVTQHGVCLGTSPSPSSNCVNDGAATTGVFTQDRTGLTAGTLYYYRGYAKNSTGYAYSPDDTFTTLIIPTVTTPTYASVTGTTVTLGANVTSLGIPASISARGTCFGTSPAPTTNCVAASGTTTGVFTQSRTGLSESTTYYYRGYATNSTGTAYSADDTFTTISSCGGQSISGYCWYPNPNQNQSCTTFCSTYSHGTCVGPVSMSYNQGIPVCTALWPGTNTTGATGDPTPRHDGTNYCYLASSSTFPDVAYSHNSCSTGQAWQNNACACSQ
jgi:type II secretory pathway pseudopilin PulG